MFFSEDRKYKTIDLPEIIAVHRDQLDGYTYIKTIQAGLYNKGVIMHGNGMYFMCMRRDDYIKVDKRLMEPIGYRRSSLEDLEELAATFEAARVKRGPIPLLKNHVRKFSFATVPSRFDMDIPWHIRMEGQYLINTNTGEEVHLGARARTEIAASIGLKSKHILSMIREGIEVDNWCFKTQRLDGKPWGKVVPKLKPHHKRKEGVDSIVFTSATGHTVPYYSIRLTAAAIGVGYEMLREAINDDWPSIGGYTITRPSLGGEKPSPETPSHQTPL